MMSNVSISDLTWQLVPYYAGRAEKRKVSDIKRVDRFAQASKVSQRSFIEVEKFFQDYFKEIEFIELSPLQPLGLNCVLADTNGKKIIPTIRGQEVNSDATTSLFLWAFMNFEGKSDVRVATNVRTVRPKIFSEKTKFLPHFKVFAEVSIGRQIDPFGKKEVDAIAKHLVDEITVLDLIRSKIPNSIDSYNVYVSNLFFLRNMVEKICNKVDRNYVDEARKVWESSGLPALFDLDDKTIERVRCLGLDKGLKILEMFLDSLFKWVLPNEKVKWFFDLSRSDGLSYYNHIAYRITAVSDTGMELPLADGGSNNWGVRMSNNKQIYTVSSGIGTELLIRNYFKLA